MEESDLHRCHDAADVLIQPLKTHGACGELCLSCRWCRYGGAIGAEKFYFFDEDKSAH